MQPSKDIKYQKPRPCLLPRFPISLPFWRLHLDYGTKYITIASPTRAKFLFHSPSSVAMSVTTAHLLTPHDEEKECIFPVIRSLRLLVREQRLAVKRRYSHSVTSQSYAIKLLV